MYKSHDMGRAVTVRRWTPAAIDCYKRGCVCNDCMYNKFFSGNHKCQMKASVLELVRTVGPPTEVELQQILEDEDIADYQ